MLGYSKKAYLLLNKYIYWIPLTMMQSREKAFKLYNKVVVELKKPWAQLTSELIKDQYEVLSGLHYDQIRLKKELL